MSEEIEDSGLNFNVTSNENDSFPLKPDEKPQMVILKDVIFNPEYAFKKKGMEGKTSPTIEYQFQSVPEPERKSGFRSFEPTGDTKEKKSNSWERIKSRFAAIYRALTGNTIPQELFANVKSVKEAYELMAKTLNTGANGKPLYKTDEGKPIFLWIIPVYFNGFVDLKLNKFIEKVRFDSEGKPKKPLIEVLPSDKIVREAKAERKGTTTGAPGENSTFDADDELPL